MTYLEEAQTIWSQFVPRSGQAETIQGELLRAVEKLRHEAIQNGNANWDQDFGLLITFLSTHLLDSRVFSPREVESINGILARLHNGEDPLLEERFFDELGDRVVDYYRYYGSQPHVKNLRLRR